MSRHQPTHGDLRLTERGMRVDPRLHPGAEADRGPEEGEGSADDRRRHQHALAAELFIHGLLTHLAGDLEAERNRRVRALMAVLPSRAVGLRGRMLLLHGEGLRAAQIAAAAMVLTAVGALSVFTASSEQVAAAIVQKSLAASSAAGDRSYRVTPIFDAGIGAEVPAAQLDLRDRDHHRFATTLPDGRQLTAGRDADGPWVTQPDGRVERFAEGRGGPRPPRWIDLGENLFLAQSIDELLAALPQEFSMRSVSNEPLPGSTTPLRRITARQIGELGPGPQRIELWIEPASGVVHRMELHWDVDPLAGSRSRRREPWQEPPGCGPRFDRGARSGDGPPFVVAPGEGPDGEFGSERGSHPRGPGGPDGPRCPGPPPRERGGDGPPGPLFEPPDEPPDGPPEGPRMGPPLGPPGGPPVGPPPGPPPRPMRPRGVHERGVPPLLAAPGPAPEGGFMDEPPRRGRGRHGPPPRTMIFELVSTEPLPADWFAPQRHSADRSAE